MKNIFTLLFVLLLPLNVWADYESGREAANRGDFETALDEWEPLAKAGNSEAQYSLGRLYANGDGVRRNFQTARQWFMRAARQGNRKAQAAVAKMYERGDGVKRDPAIAALWRKGTPPARDDVASPADDKPSNVPVAELATPVQVTPEPQNTNETKSDSLRDFPADISAEAIRLDEMVSRTIREFSEIDLPENAELWGEKGKHKECAEIFLRAALLSPNTQISMDAEIERQKEALKIQKVSELAAKERGEKLKEKRMALCEAAYGIYWPPIQINFDDDRLKSIITGPHDAFLGELARHIQGRTQKVSESSSENRRELCPTVKAAFHVLSTTKDGDRWKVRFYRDSPTQISVFYISSEQVKGGKVGNDKYEVEWAPCP